MEAVMIRTNIYLSEEQVKKLKEIYKDTGVRAAEVIRRALDEYIGKRKGKVRK
jgi:hypothetical protein